MIHQAAILYVANNYVLSGLNITKSYLKTLIGTATHCSGIYRGTSLMNLILEYDIAVQRAVDYVVVNRNV
jgi:hypothetical protein